MWGWYNITKGCFCVFGAWVLIVLFVFLWCLWVLCGLYVFVCGLQYFGSVCVFLRVFWCFSGVFRVLFGLYGLLSVLCLVIIWLYLAMLVWLLVG